MNSGRAAVLRRVPTDCLVHTGRVYHGCCTEPLPVWIAGAMDSAVQQAQNPYNTLGVDNITTPEMLALATTAARRAIILVKNINRTLPLQYTPPKPTSLHAHAVPSTARADVWCVYGPNANDTMNQMGGYVNRNPPYITTPFGALRNRLLDAPTTRGAVPQVRLVTAGCTTTACEQLHRADVEAAARQCNVHVVVLGLTSDARSKDEPGDACGCPDGDAIEVGVLRMPAASRADTEMCGYTSVVRAAYSYVSSRFLDIGVYL